MEERGKQPREHMLSHGGKVPKHVPPLTLDSVVMILQPQDI